MRTQAPGGGVIHLRSASKWVVEVGGDPVLLRLWSVFLPPS